MVTMVGLALVRLWMMSPPASAYTSAGMLTEASTVTLSLPLPLWMTRLPKLPAYVEDSPLAVMMNEEPDWLTRMESLLDVPSMRKALKPTIGTEVIVTASGDGTAVVTLITEAVPSPAEFHA